MINLKTVSGRDLGIDASMLSPRAVDVVKTLQEAGYQAYLVGGCIRDSILGMRPKDFDVATNAAPEQIKTLFKQCRIIGRRFKIVHVRFGREVIEVTTFRASASDRDKVDSEEMREGEQGQLLRDNVFGTLEEDVMRRDFTANALYYDPIENTVLDYIDGVQAINDKKLISIGDVEQRFMEDPVRMLRVIRFSAKLGFEMQPAAQTMIEDQGQLLSNVSSARLFEEVLKLFHGGAAYATFLLLRKYGIFKYLFPFTDQCVVDGVEGMPEKSLQNTDKRIAVGKPVIPAFLFACMLWDPVKSDAEKMLASGQSPGQAWRIAMQDALRDQNQYVAVPRRLAEIILDIWHIHFRLLKRNPVMIQTSLNNRRFRAAYDFLLLRVSLHEESEEIGEWWTKIQDVDDEEKQKMILELTENYSREREKGNIDSEPNWNKVNFNAERKPSSNRHQKKPKPARRNDSKGRRKSVRSKRKTGNSARPNDDNLGNSVDYKSKSHGNALDYSPSAGNARRRNESANTRGHSMGNGGYSDHRGGSNYSEQSMSNQNQNVSKKKVKIRKKKKVVLGGDEPSIG